MKLQKKSRAIFYILAAAFCFALMNLFVSLAGDIPPIQKSFFRNLVAAFFAFFVLKRKNQDSERPTLKKGDLKYLLGRSIFGTLGIFCNFYAIGKLNISDASMLNKLSPFFAILFSFFLLKEKLKLYQAVCVLTAFSGTLFILKPGSHSLAFVPALIGMASGLFAGFAYTMVRILGNRGVKGPYIVFFFSAFSCLSSLPYSIFHFTPMSRQQLISLILAGFSAMGGQFAITAAYSNAPAKEISIYDYSQIIFAALLGFFFLGEIPDRLSLIGYIIICGASLVMFLLNNRNSSKTVS